MDSPAKIRIRSRLGKYRVEKVLAQGHYADVFQAYDTVEGIRVALKIPRGRPTDKGSVEEFKHEVRLTAPLDHPNILPIKNADFIGNHFVVASVLGDCALHERLSRRLSLAKALSYSEQILAGLAHAHAHRILHGDVKPENFILFGDRLRLTDFGIAKIALRTMQASGSGTIGYMSPEQALGRPSLRSDVFAAGLVLYRLFAGIVPEWPFDWPPPGFEQRIKNKLHPDLIEVLRRSLRIDPRQRYADARQMSTAFQAVLPRALKYRGSRKRTRKTRTASDWRQVKLRHFVRRYGRKLELAHECSRCHHPVAESMLACPWCGTGRATHRGETTLPARCPRCRRGVKLDWRYCPWCYGESIGPQSTRSFRDRRYSARCPNASCSRREVWPFMRYCPWCRVKVKRPWSIPEKSERCPHCKWGALSEYWKTCPWCAKSLNGSHSRSGSRVRR
jgi:hypothetical protein